MSISVMLITQLFILFWKHSDAICILERSWTPPTVCQH